MNRKLGKIKSKKLSRVHLLSYEEEDMYGTGCGIEVDKLATDWIVTGEKRGVDCKSCQKTIGFKARG